MPRPKKQLEQNREEQELIMVSSEGEEPDELEKVLGTLPSEEEVISLYRMHDQGRPKFIDKISPAEFDLKNVRGRFGGGRFKAVVWAGNKRVEKVFEIEGKSIESEPKPRMGNPNWLRKADERVADPTIDSYSVGVSAEALIIQELRSLRQALTEAPRRDDSVIDKLVSTVLANTLSAPDKSEEKFLKWIQVISGMFPKSNVDAGTIFNAIKQGMELVANGGITEEKANKWVDVLQGILNHPFVKNLATNLAKVPTQPSQAPILAEQRREIPMSDFIRFVGPILTPHLPALVEAAKTDEDPTFFGDMILKRLPPQHKDTAVQWLDGQWFQELVALEPKVEYQAGWWKDLRDYLYAKLTGQVLPEGEHDGA